MANFDVLRGVETVTVVFPSTRYEVARVREIPIWADVPGISYDGDVQVHYYK